MTPLEAAPFEEPLAPKFSVTGVVASVDARRVLIAMPAEGARSASLTVGTQLLIDGRPDTVAVVSGVETPAADADAERFELVIAEAAMVGRINDEGGVEPRPMSPPVGARVSLLDTDHVLSVRETSLGRPIPIGGAPGPISLEGERLLDQGLSLCGARHATAPALAVVLRSLLRQRFPARIVLIDPTDLFTDSFGGAAAVVDGSLGIVPCGYLTAEELSACLELIGEPLDSGEQRVLRSMARGRGGTLQDLISDVERERGQGAPGAACASMVRRLHAARDDGRLAPFFGSDADRLTPEDVLQSFFRLPDGRPPMAICQLGGVAPVIRPLAAQVITRLGRMLAESTHGRVPVLVASHELSDLKADHNDEPSPFFATITTGRTFSGAEPALLLEGVAIERTSDAALAAQALDEGEAILMDPTLPWPQLFVLDELPDHAVPQGRRSSGGPGDVRSLIEAALSAFERPVA